MFNAEEVGSFVQVDEDINLKPGLLSRDDVEYVKDLITDSCSSFVGLINSGFPSPTHVVDTLLHFQVRVQHIKCRQIIEPALKLVFTANYYYNSKSILERSINALNGILAHEDFQRIETGFRRLNRATNVSDNPYDVLEAIENPALSEGQYAEHLASVYKLVRLAGINTEDYVPGHYPRLGVFNHIYKPPLFTALEAVETYSENLKNLTLQTEGSGLRLLTAVHRSRDPDLVVNDVMFLLSLSHLNFMHAAELSSMYKWIGTQASMLCSSLYMCYTQVPETRDVYAAIVRGVYGFVHRPPENASLRPVLKNVLSMIRKLEAADVYIVPGYLATSVFSLLLKLHNAIAQEDGVIPVFLEGRRATSEPYTVPDPTSPFDNARYVFKNPYSRDDLFKCPQNLIQYLGPDFITSKPTQQILMEVSETEVTFENYELALMHSLMVEGAASQLKMLPQQLTRYLHNTPTSADVVEDSDAEDSLFADVQLRTLSTDQPARRRRRRQRASLMAILPYSRSRGRRRPLQPIESENELVDRLQSASI